MDIFIIITLTITSIASIVYLLNLSKKEISGTKGIPQNHEKKAYEMTFLGCENQLAYGTVGILNKKIISFDRNITFNSVNTKKNEKLKAYVYSGMCIMNRNLLKMNFEKFENFEKQLYPKIIKKFKCDFKNFRGFWHSVDNIKDIENTKKENNFYKFNEIRKIVKKIK